MALLRVCPIKQWDLLPEKKCGGKRKRIGTRLGVARACCLWGTNSEDSRHGESRNSCDSSFSVFTCRIACHIFMIRVGDLAPCSRWNAFCLCGVGHRVHVHIHAHSGLTPCQPEWIIPRNRVSPRDRVSMPNSRASFSMVPWPWGSFRLWWLCRMRGRQKIEKAFAKGAHV